MNAPILALFSPFALFFLRIVIGLVFIARGYAEIKKSKQNKGALAAFVKFLGGVALVLGFFTQYTAALLAVLMIVIIGRKIKEREKFIGGLDSAFVFLVACFVLLTLGGGSILSLDIFLPQLLL